jgi:hypothetical protein
MSTPGPTRPPGRYDDQGGRRRPAAVAAVVVLAAGFAAWVLWAALGAATPDVRSDVTSFTIADAGTVRAAIEVTAEARRPVTCTVQAEDRTRETVGIARVTLPPGPDATRHATVVVRTRSLAVTAVISGCRLGAAKG